MESDLRTAFINRRSYYDINAVCPVPDAEIEDIVKFAVTNTPSAFNSQSARVVLLFGHHHHMLWKILREALRSLVPADKFGPTDTKINSFDAGYGTILFYEDRAVIDALRQDYPLYKDMFPGFSANSAGMLQYVVWVMLRQAGLGASLQHYGNLIEAEVAKTWDVDPRWQLVAQMPFGGIVSEPGIKEQLPLEQRVRIFH